MRGWQLSQESLASLYIEQWRNAEKKSLCSGFNAADPDAIIAWNRRMEDLVAMDEITKAIRHKVPAQKLRKRTTLTKIQREWLKKRLDKSDFGERMRLHYYLGVVLEDENEIQECFHIIQDQVGGATPGLKYISSMPGLKQEIKVTHSICS